MPNTIAEFMTPCPHSVGAEQPLLKAMEFMRTHHVRHLPVLHGGELVGMLSDRDVVLLENLADMLREEIDVEQAMSTEPFTVGSDAPLASVLKEMADRHLGSAVVVDNNKVVGIFTSSDAVRMLADRVG